MLTPASRMQARRPRPRPPRATARGCSRRRTARGARSLVGDGVRRVRVSGARRRSGIATTARAAQPSAGTIERHEHPGRDADEDGGRREEERAARCRRATDGRGTLRSAARQPRSGGPGARGGEQRDRRRPRAGPADDRDDGAAGEQRRSSRGRCRAAGARVSTTPTSPTTSPPGSACASPPERAAPATPRRAR